MKYISRKELGKRYCMPSSTLHRLVTRKDFPKPVEQFLPTIRYKLADVEKWEK